MMFVKIYGGITRAIYSLLARFPLVCGKNVRIPCCVWEKRGNCSKVRIFIVGKPSLSHAGKASCAYNCSIMDGDCDYISYFQDLVLSTLKYFWLVSIL